MKDMVKTCAKEIGRAIVSAVLAYFGLTASGCIAIGDNSTAAFSTHASESEVAK